MASHQLLHSACACSAGGSFKLTGTERKYERSRPFVVTHQALELTLDFKEQAVVGIATLEFTRRAPSGTVLSLDAVAFELHAVQLKCTGARQRKLKLGTDFQYDGDTLDIDIPEGTETGQVRISYKAVPRQGLYFLQPDKEVPERPVQAWSQCQDEDGRHFFPCQDKPHVKMTSEMRVQVPRKMTVLSGGELQSLEKPRGGLWSYHFRLDVPAPAYLMTLVAGEFDQWDEEVSLPSGRTIPLRYLVPPGRSADGQRAFSGTGAMIQLFSRLTGVEYPWDRYSQIVVNDFIFGGMENTTATTMYEHILLDERASVDIESHDLVAHELAHQWFGDLVTCRDWPHAWLNEGFATYFELVEKEARLGRDEYDEGVLADFQAYLGEARASYTRAIVCRDYDEPIDLFDRHLYQKGGVVLHLLRKELGDACFWNGVCRYLERHRGGIVETTDLVRAMEESSGLSLDAFFDHWVYRPGHPELSLKLGYSQGALTLEVEQTQQGEDVAVFDLHVEMRAIVGRQDVEASKRVSERKDSLVLRCEKRPSMVEIDPDFRLPATIDLSGPQDLLRAMLNKGRSARTRKMAATALGKRPDPENITSLGQCLMSKKESHIVRAEAASSLAKLRGPQALMLLQGASTVEHPKVRRAVAQGLGQFDDETTVQLLTQLTNDTSYLVSAAAARALGATKSPTAEKTLTTLLGRDSWADVVRSAALDGLAESGASGAEAHLIEWSKYGRPLRARRTAINALPRAGEGRKIREHLASLLRDRDPHTRSAVLGALGSLGDAKARGAITDLLKRELDGRVRRRAKQVMSELGKSGAPGLSEARQKTQKLEKDLASLQARLSRLEQLTGYPKPAPSGGPATGGSSSQTTPAHAGTKTAPTRRVPAERKATSRGRRSGGKPRK